MAAAQPGALVGYLCPWVHETPFGGVKASTNGFYKKQGQAALEFFSSTKSVYFGS